jgi:hypothetical protein
MGLSTLMAEIICLVGRRETLNGRLCECFYKYIKLYKLNGIILMNEEDTLTVSDSPKTQMIDQIALSNVRGARKPFIGSRLSIEDFLEVGIA